MRQQRRRRRSVLEEGRRPPPPPCRRQGLSHLYEQKASDEDEARIGHYVSFEPPWRTQRLEACAVAAEAVRFAQRIHDAPPNETGPIQLVAEAEAVASRGDSISITKIVGESYARKGTAVFMESARARRSRRRSSSSRRPSIGRPRRALVGKTICFDTGGLSLKISGGMVGMKADLGGGAACLAGFEAACA